MESLFKRGIDISYHGFRLAQLSTVYNHRESQTVYSVFINHQLPRHENTAVLDGEKKPNKRSDSRGGCTPFCGALIENRM